MDILKSIIALESSGKPNKKNEKSSATGLGQFVDGTWLDMMRRHHSDLIKGKSRDEILAMRTDPELSREMTAKYAEENERALRDAHLPVTPGSIYLMHFAGPGGAPALMKADPNTPVESILSKKAIASNDFLRGKTAGWVIDWANRKMANAATPTPRAAPQPTRWGGQPVPDLAQTQAVEPAFAATGWPSPPTSPNVLSPDDVRRLTGVPGKASIPFVSGTTRAQQALDNSLPAPGAAPWDLSDRFGDWRGLGGVFGPVSSSGSRGLGQTGDGNGPGVSNGRSARAGVDPSASLQKPTAFEINGGAPPFPLEALLASDPSRGLNEWASSSRRQGSPSVAPGVTIGLADPMASVARTDPSNSDRTSAGGLLGLIQDYMRGNGY